MAAVDIPVPDTLPTVIGVRGTRHNNRRDIDSGLASGQVLGTPTPFIDGVVHRRGYDPPTLLAP
jgi:hypothetical protein